MLRAVSYVAAHRWHLIGCENLCLREFSENKRGLLYESWDFDILWCS